MSLPKRNNYKSKTDNKTLTDRSLSGIVAVLSGQISQSLLSIIVMIILARLLSPREFGIIGAAMIVVGLSQIFSHIGVGPALVQRPNLEIEHIRVGFTLSVMMGSIVGLVFYNAAPLIADFFGIPILKKVVQVLALVFPISGLGVVGQALLQRNMQFGRLALIGFMSYLLGYGILGIFLAASGWGVWALVGAQLGQTAIHTLILLQMKKEVLGFSLRGTELRQLLNFGAGFSLARVSNYLATQADNLVVGRWLGTEALGIYGRAYQFLIVPANLVGSVVDKVLFPVMASVQDDKVRLGRAYARAVALVAMLTFPMSGFLVSLAPEIVYVLLGEQWMGVVLPFQILASGLVFRTSYKISDSLARATGAVYRRAWRQCIYAGAVFIGAWLGHFWGLIGVSCGVFAAIALNFILMLHLSFELVTCSWRALGAVHLRYAGIGGITGVCMWTLKSALGGFNVPPALVIGAGMVSVLMAFACIWLVMPRIFGEEGAWLITLIKRNGQVAAGRLRIGERI